MQQFQEQGFLKALFREALRQIDNADVGNRCLYSRVLILDRGCICLNLNFG
jgi:hypothetical protein